MKNLTAEFIKLFDTSRDLQLCLKLIDRELTDAQEALAHIMEGLSNVRYVIDREAVLDMSNNHVTGVIND